jgi:hypothetical protein
VEDVSTGRLRDDIVILRRLVDAALDEGADERLLYGLAQVLRDRRERLEALERHERDAGGS